jgi:glycosyltransferase involved in cell wall biosynthesis
MSPQPQTKTKIAFIHRYGLEGWICCGGHAVPGIIERLSKDAEIHFYGPKTTENPDPELRARLVMHELPYTWDRANPRDKFTKTLLWYLRLPGIGLRCRRNGTRLIWNDETVPFTALILQLFFGKQIAITVMDFFARIYTDKKRWLYWLRDLVEWIDFRSWKKVPLIFTKVLYTQEFLAGHGVSKTAMHLYRNPVDHTKFHPVDDAIRQATRAKYGFGEKDIVLTHHGILHPNKGNDWILHRIAELKNDLPNLKFMLIGNGPEMEHLSGLAAEQGISDQIVFTGWLPTEQDLNHALASADIGLVMRIGQSTDHFHMTDTLAHEMACGKALLAVNLHGITEVIADGKNGYSFPADDPTVFNQKLSKLYASPAERQLLGNAILQTSTEICDVASSALSVTHKLNQLANADTLPT